MYTHIKQSNLPNVLPLFNSSKWNTRCDVIHTGSIASFNACTAINPDSELKLSPCSQIEILDFVGCYKSTANDLPRALCLRNSGISSAGEKYEYLSFGYDKTNNCQRKQDQ